jgi:hypothetical protein
MKTQNNQSKVQCIKRRQFYFLVNYNFNPLKKKNCFYFAYTCVNVYSDKNSMARSRGALIYYFYIIGVGDPLLGLELWCLMPLSTIFQLYRGGRVSGGGNQRKPLTCCKSLTNFMYRRMSE